MKEKLVVQVKIWNIRWGAKLKRFNEGIINFVAEGWEKHLPITSMHFGRLRTTITFRVEEIPMVVPMIRKHLGEFLPKRL